MEDINPELEQFRQQWRAEVSAKTQVDGNRDPKSTKIPRRLPPSNNYTSSRNLKPSQDDEDAEPPILHPLDGSPEEIYSGESSKAAVKEPQSALEHYEKAVEREASGKLGESMDDRVDQKYRSKHFPPSYFASKPSNPNPSNASSTVPNPAHHSLDGPPKTIKQLIAAFSGLVIEPAPPVIEGTPAPPCPIATLPEEILVHIFTDTAILDVSSFARLAQVCKRMAYLVATEEQIWKRVCLGVEVGFGGMHYQWQREVLGGPLKEEEDESNFSDSNSEAVTVPPLDKATITDMLYRDAYSSSYQQMFRLRPRIRFNGCYISTVNYQRAGQASQSQVTWHSPVHIVTYYRYLRFFRDGTVISLLTTSEPNDVVHHLSKELQDYHRGGHATHLPSIVMQHALRGRWRLSTTTDNPDGDIKDAEGDVFIETEGVSKKYMYRMRLALRSAGKGGRNNKLVWHGFWNYNVLTGDDGEFTLRNDKAFFWSRVRSYGEGA
ncbi:related to H. sapiens F-box protein [Rhynchosporium agropyri]|uniref:Related to H. sapiens F-box protein n=1 Tax=Rhynchosporium agropyri TaxID=914238 RepID=A0A1E1KPM0_9HELO|nr:related to H. sapiens F-box protein [Rhynchosporium agropyri]